MEIVEIGIVLGGVTQDGFHFSACSSLRYVGWLSLGAPFIVDDIMCLLIVKQFDSINSRNAS